MSAARAVRVSGLFLLAMAEAFAQPQVLTFFSSVDDSDQPYALYLPRNFVRTHKYPLVISLHGAGSNHRLNLRRVFGRGNRPGESDAEAIRYFPAFRDVDFIVASPMARGTMGFQGVPEKDVYDVLADVEKRFPVDEDRVYLTGLSMGGGGSLWLGLTRPDVWAAIAPVCPAPPAAAAELAPNALNLPLQFFQGALDPLVNPQIARGWFARLKALDSPVEYTEYPGVRHNSWDNAYKDGAIFDWFAQFRRNRFPDRVRFVSSRYEYRAAYWVQLDELTPGVQASMDARFIGPNRLEITTRELAAFTLTPAGHPKYTAGRPLSVTVDGRVVRMAGKSLSFSMRSGVWTNAKATAVARSKRSGIEGPIGAAFSDHHLYVYGTADYPSQEELNARREIAQRSAEWSTSRNHLQLSFRVVADHDVKPSDLERGNLILFGTRETNSQIDRIAAGLPFELNAGAADYGLFYIFPNGSHYVVINSGLPWWTGAEHLPKAPFAYLPLQVNVAAGLGDFVLFRGSVETPVVEGRFDHQWHLPADAAARMRATGAIKVR